MGENLSYLAHVYLHYSREITETHRKVVRALLEYDPGPFRGVPTLRHEIYDIADEDISFVQRPDGSHALHAAAHQLVLSLGNKSVIWPLKKPRAGLVGTFETFDCEGTRDQIVDYCVLRLRAQSTNAARLREIRKVLRTVRGTEPPSTYGELVSERLARRGFTDETEWVLDCIGTGRPGLMGEAIRAAFHLSDPRLARAACPIFLNRGLPADLRANAMHLASKHNLTNVLAAFADTLDDPHPTYGTNDLPQFQADYPLRDHPVFVTVRPALQRMYGRSTNTIGGLAQEYLKKMTKKDFGADAERWKAWIGHSAS